MAFSRMLFLFLSLSLNAMGYFQQKVNYTIKVELDDVNHFLNGHISFEYQNNSPDTLNKIWIHLWPNAYKDNSSALVQQQLISGNTDLYFADETERGYIDSLQFLQGDLPIGLVMQEIDYGYLTLQEPIAPGGKSVISTPFRVKIPSSRFSRLGHDRQAYYISQWYPKPAVYDAEGWHAMPYLDQGEFYSEFGDYSVTITLPENYVISSTGECRTESEVAWLLDKAQQTETIITADNAFPPSSPVRKTIQYGQSDIHDFAWFADKRYNVMKSNVVLPSGKSVDTWAFFTGKDAAYWVKCVEYINAAIYHYSSWIGEYIYSSCSAAQGTFGVSSGMEYPMVTLIGDAFDKLSFETIVAHEVGHNWFCGMLANNERKDPWMDEGLNSFYEMLYVNERYRGSSENVNELLVSGRLISKAFGLDRLSYADAWQFQTDITSSVNSGQPPGLEADEYTFVNYGIDVYRKAGLYFNYLNAHLGDSVFARCMQQYFIEWKLRHPGPEDFRNVFESVSGQNLNWFFDLLYTKNTTDYSLSKIEAVDNIYNLKVRNKGAIPVPFSVYGLRGDSLIVSKKLNGFTGVSNVVMECSGCSSFYIDYNRATADFNRGNNNLRTKGIFRKSDPVRISFFPKAEKDNTKRLCVLPVAGWNNYNEWMAGVTVYNKFLPVRNFEYVLTPMYGFGDQKMAGMGLLNYYIFPKSGALGNIALNLKARQFAYDNVNLRRSLYEFDSDQLHYLRVEPEVILTFRKKHALLNVTKKAGVSYIYINEEQSVLREVHDDFNVTGIATKDRYTLRGWFRYESDLRPDPWSLQVNGEGNGAYQKLSVTGNYKFSYRKKGKGVIIRAFAGYMPASDEDNAYPFALSGWSGIQDHWYDELYFGRSETRGKLHQQMTMHEGGFKVYVPYARSTEWLTALNLNIDLPGMLPVSLFADVGTYSDAKEYSALFDSQNGILFDGGVTVDLFHVVKVHFPVLKSGDMKNFLDGQSGARRVSFGEQIRFEVNLNGINPFYLRNKLF